MYIGLILPFKVLNLSKFLDVCRINMIVIYSKYVLAELNGLFGGYWQFVFGKFFK